jgi:putative GTP pyrophosphokinase
MEEIPNTEENLDEIMLKYSFALEILMTQIKILIKDYEFRHNTNPVEHVKSRIKSKESAIKKLEKKGYDITLENIKNHVHDMIGVRIVCSFISDVYEIVSVIEKSEQIKIKETKDYIMNPKESGYMSYHLIVTIPVTLSNNVEYIDAEIQIRTIAMDFWASLDHKIQYKFTDIVPDEVKKEIKNCALVIKTLDNKMLGLNEIVKKYKEN